MLNESALSSSLRRYGAALLTVLLTLSTSATHANNLPVQTQVVTAEPFHTQIARTGRIDFRYITQLSFKTPGYIRQLHADSGQKVAANTTLATIELTDLKAAQASAQATYEKSVQDAVRARKLYKEKKTISKDFLEQAETALIQSKSGRARANYDLTKARIEAPFDAIVIDRFMQPGEQAQAGVPVFAIASLSESNFVVRLDLTQQEVGQVTQGDVATVTLPDQSQVAGHILSIAATANATTGLYEVEVSLELKGHSVFSGQWVRIEININRNQQVFPIPVIALAGISKGKVNVVTQQQDAYQLSHFDLVHMDPKFIYVSAEQSELQVVTRGWKRLLPQLED